MNKKINEPKFIENTKKSKIFGAPRIYEILDGIESELLLRLFDYAVPFLNKKINVKESKNKNQKESNLENIVNSKPKIDFKDMKELESMLLRNLSENAKINQTKKISSNKVFYSLNLARKENNDEKFNNYSVSIKYEETTTSEKLSISIKKSEKEVYSAEIIDKKEARDKVIPYSIRISYESNYAEERLSITYKSQLKNYLHKHIEEKEDMTNRVPLKWVNILPETMMGGVLGFTYIGDHSMGRRADLTGKTARMVDIHESIHTPDEYETRILTSWIMEKAKGKYVK